ncbi:MAG: hypothetical protein GY856_11750 [bacterium]|nr:hypothetical protein [bacterium]
MLAIADRDVSQSQTPGLGPEWRFDIAYNAVLQLATAALAAAGYRAERANKHQRTLESLEYTVRIGRERVLFLDVCRRKRHKAVYERVGAISDAEADEMTAAATLLRSEVANWIREMRPELWSPEGD